MEGVTDSTESLPVRHLPFTAGSTAIRTLPQPMKLGTLIAILGEHSPLRDNLCRPPHEELAHADQEEIEGANAAADATASGPAGWPE